MKKIHLNVKEEKGVSSVVVLVTVLTFACILTGIFAIVMTRAGGQVKSDMRIQEIYGNEVDRADEIYEEIIDEIEANTYTITYYLDGGTGVTDRTYRRITPTFTLPTPTKPNYEFIGWTGSNGNVPQTEVTIEQGSTGDKSYTANWAYNEYKVIGEVQTTSTGGSNASVRVKIYGTSINQNILYTTANNGQDKDFGFFTLSYGKTSLKWRIEENSGCELYYYTSSETIDNKHEIGTENLEWGYNSSILYYIVAKDVFYNITYNLDGGTGETTGFYSQHTPAFSLPTNVTKSGFLFHGWTGSNGSVPQKEVIIPKGSTGDKTYTANWTTAPSSIRYYKIVITKLRSTPASSAIQMSEWYLYDTNQNKYTYPTGTTITTTLAGSSSESIEKLIDNNTGTKYCSTRWGSSQTGECTIEIDLGEGNEINLGNYPYYSYCTANDSDSRDPISWTIYCSADGENFFQVDSRSDVNDIPTARRTETTKWIYSM